MALRTLFARSASCARATSQNVLKTTTTRALSNSARRHQLRAPDASDPRLSTIDASQLTITTTTTPKEITPHSELVFGRAFTDHMLSLEWTASDGWLSPRITPYQNLSLDPATCVLHYAFEAFEGMKAYKDKAGNVRLFRPDKNMARLNKSVARIALPTFNGEAVIELLKKFVKLEERFIPDQKG